MCKIVKKKKLERAGELNIELSKFNFFHLQPFVIINRNITVTPRRSGLPKSKESVRNNELAFGAEQFRIQRISSGTARDRVERGPGQRGATTQHATDLVLV